MSDLKYAIEILKDDLEEITSMQSSPKLASDEITFKERRKSLEMAIKLLQANEANTSKNKALDIDLVIETDSMKVKNGWNGNFSIYENIKQVKITNNEQLLIEFKPDFDKM